MVVVLLVSLVHMCPACLSTDEEHSDVRFNDRWHEFSETAAAGGTVPSAA